MTEKTPIPLMVTQVSDTLKDKPGKYNVHGIVREIVESWGQCDIPTVALKRAREYRAIVRMHDMAEPSEDGHHDPMEGESVTYDEGEDFPPDMTNREVLDIAFLHRSYWTRVSEIPNLTEIQRLAVLEAICALTDLKASTYQRIQSEGNNPQDNPTET